MTTIDIDTPAGPIDALLSIPEGEGPWPGVVVIHDAFGYAPDNELVSGRIARAAMWRSPRICTPGAAAADASPGSCESC